MSKSRGTFINARTYWFDTNYLRYYYAAKLGPGMDDIDLNLDDFVARVNSDLVGKLVSIASRCAGFISKKFDGSATTLEDETLYAEFAAESEHIAEAYEAREFSKAMRRVMALADRANRYIEQKKPWVMVKDDSQRLAVQSVCTQGLNLFRTLVIYLAPVLPDLTAKARELFGERPWHWSDATRPALGATIKPYRPMLTRVETSQVQAMLEKSREPAELSAGGATRPGRHHIDRRLRKSGSAGRPHRECAAGRWRRQAAGADIEPRRRAA
ncbi:MAG: class I tRNA ligase family protein [Woeseiaceae bacterium]|nr:class I tRNA ligase family protein [Woeseiaceae bacterium]